MILLLQTPTTPPVPPVPGPETHSMFGGGLDEVASALVAIVFFITACLLLWPLMRAFARRLEGRAAGAQLQSELVALQDRVQALEQEGVRLVELEERLDFAERLLAQAREPERLPS